MSSGEVREVGPERDQHPVRRGRDLARVGFSPIGSGLLGLVR